MRRYVHGPGLDEPLVWYEGASTSDRRWLHADQLGSVIAVSNASGAMLAINAYDEYGAPSSSNAGRFQYTGQMWLPEAGLYHYRARAYAPSLGRFLQSDPILQSGGMNLYAYVGNDPVNATDPWGLDLVKPRRDCEPKCSPIVVTRPRPPTIWGAHVCTSNCQRGSGPPTPGANTGWNGERGLPQEFGRLDKQDGDADADDQQQCPTGFDADLAESAIHSGSQATAFGLGFVGAGQTAVWVSGGVWPQVDAAGAAAVAFGTGLAGAGGALQFGGALYLGLNGDPRRGVTAVFSQVLTSRLNVGADYAAGGIIEMGLDYMMDKAGWPECP